MLGESTLSGCTNLNLVGDGRNSGNDISYTDWYIFFLKSQAKQIQQFC